MVKGMKTLSLPKFLVRILDNKLVEPYSYSQLIFTKKAPTNTSTFLDTAQF